MELQINREGTLEPATSNKLQLLRARLRKLMELPKNGRFVAPGEVPGWLSAARDKVALETKWAPVFNAKWGLSPDAGKLERREFLRSKFDQSDDLTDADLDSLVETIYWLNEFILESVLDMDRDLMLKRSQEQFMQAIEQLQTQKPVVLRSESSLPRAQNPFARKSGKRSYDRNDWNACAGSRHMPMRSGRGSGRYR